MPDRDGAAGRVSSLGDLTAEDVARTAPDAVLVIPIGATEQHGPCLPMRTDALLVERVLAAGLTRLRDTRPIVVSPALPFGHSQHHLFAAAASLRPETLLAVLRDLLDSAYRSGFRRVFVINGHGGNDECIRLAVKDGVNRHPMVLAACSYWDLVDPEWRREQEHVPGHAGAFETSLMLALAPELVITERLGSAEPGPTAVHERGIAPGVTVARAGDWAASGGYTDRPDGATASAGEALLDDLAERMANALDRFCRLPLTLAEESS
jgi:creatinine amidohydrolase